MNTKSCCLAVVSVAAIIGCETQPGVRNLAIVAPGATVQKVAGGFKFTEGPAADVRGNIFFTDIPNSRIHKWLLEGTVSTFLENSDGANGLFFDRNGNLLACAGGMGRLVSIDPRGRVRVLAEKYEGKPFNSPNDLWQHPRGGIYFTDPRYGERENLPQDGEHVYYLSSDRERLIRVIDDMVRPNGLIGTRDGKLLYVADHGANKTYVYKINSDGTLSDKKLFVPQGSDGMTMDERGNVYLTAAAVVVYDAEGSRIHTIDVPERPSNVCFGDRDKRTLFITARTSLYAVRMQVKGL
ncbi:MAG TPA: SMP-30/gluconolactonase/LRE family protein [Sedimentisphaerales bacterium]|nr:SMP-30/gluconolactonase/LRE family protein [Sedimentisphaerales bacterium]